MRQFGLIGFPLEHSFSKGYFTEKFLREDIRDCHYENFPIASIHEFPELIAAQPSLRGLNVTIPYKKQVMQYLDAIDEEAAEIGAVNTVRFDKGRATGFNTDVYGFVRSLEPYLPEHPLKALILGTGGASMAIAHGLRSLGIDFRFVSKSGRRDCMAYEQLTVQKISRHHLIVNCTPVGMFPLIDAMPPIPYQGVGAEHILYDLVYNPEQTRFMKEGERRGATVCNGLEMLHLQAERSWEIWNE